MRNANWAERGRNGDAGCAQGELGRAVKKRKSWWAACDARGRSLERWGRLIGLLRNARGFDAFS